MPTLTNTDTATEARLRELVSAVHFLANRGWTPATSSNFSLRSNEKEFLISVSGLDKGDLTTADFLPVDAEGHVLDPKRKDSKPSAETRLHGWVYRRFAQASVVLHTHSVNGTVMGKLHEAQGVVSITGFEMLKAFAGVKTHEATVTIPVFPNSQNMTALAETIDRWYEANVDQPLYGFLLAGHGLYCWGENAAEARRHAETFEFLFECLLKLKLAEGKA